MKTGGMEKLMGALLDRQIETGKYGLISAQRLRQALTTGPELDDAEKSLLLLSPVARDDYQQARETIRLETLERLSRNGVETELLPLAAADDGAQEVVILEGNGFSVNLYAQDDAGKQWVILVQLDENFRNSINPMTSLRLMDSGGLEWLRGRDDANGELSGVWLDDEINLLSRTRKYSLFLEPA